MNKDIRRVVITGMGAVTPLGNSAELLWKAVVSGQCGINRIQGFDDEKLPVSVAGQVKGFDPRSHDMTMAEIRHYDLFSQYAISAASEAMFSSGLASGDNIDPLRIGVYIGSCIGGLTTFVNQTKIYMKDGAKGVSPLFAPMIISNIAGGNIAIKFNLQGPCMTVTSACATGTNAIGEAYVAIRDGRADVILAGGSEAALHPLALGGFASCRALTLESDPQEASLPFDLRRRGFVMAEGAGVVVLEEYGHAVRRGARIIAEVCGYGHTCDAYHYTAPRPDGIATAKAISDALEEAEFTTDDILYINAHGTGTVMNDRAETKAIKLALGETEAQRASISSSKSMIGHMMGAAGAVECIITALALKNGIVPPTINLLHPDPECDLDYTPISSVERQLTIAISNSMGFGGHNACLALRRYCNG